MVDAGSSGSASFRGNSSGNASNSAAGTASHSVGCSVIVRKAMSSIPAGPRVDVLPPNRRNDDQHAGLFQGEVAKLASAAWPHRTSSRSSSTQIEAVTRAPARSAVRSRRRTGGFRDERLRHGTLIFASVLIALISLIWVSTYFAYGYPISAAIPALYQLTTVVGLIVLARTRRFGVFRTTQLLAFLVLPALLQASLGGFVASSAMILWAIFTPLAALALQGLRRSVAVVGGVLRRARGARAARPAPLAGSGGAPDGLRDHILRAERYGAHPERVCDARVLRGTA